MSALTSSASFVSVVRKSTAARRSASRGAVVVRARESTDTEYFPYDFFFPLRFPPSRSGVLSWEGAHAMPLGGRAPLSVLDGALEADM